MALVLDETQISKDNEKKKNTIYIYNIKIIRTKRGVSIHEQRGRCAQDDSLLEEAAHSQNFSAVFFSRSTK